MEVTRLGKSGTGPGPTMTPARRVLKRADAPTDDLAAGRDRAGKGVSDDHGLEAISQARHLQRHIAAVRYGGSQLAASVRAPAHDGAARGNYAGRFRTYGQRGCAGRRIGHLNRVGRSDVFAAPPTSDPASGRDGTGAGGSDRHSSDAARESGDGDGGRRRIHHGPAAPALDCTARDDGTRDGTAPPYGGQGAVADRKRRHAREVGDDHVDEHDSRVTAGQTRVDDAAVPATPPASSPSSSRRVWQDFCRTAPATSASA